MRECLIKKESWRRWHWRWFVSYDLPGFQAGPNFMALLTVSIESVLMEAGNSVLAASVFQGLAAKFGLCAWVFHVTRHFTLTRLAQKFDGES